MQFANDMLYKYCVGTANEGGGKLVLGISDQPPRKVVGTTAFPNPVKVKEKLFRAINFRVDIEEVPHPNGRILVFHIPSRPQGTAYHLKGVYLMRVGQELKPMSEDRLRQIFTEGQPNWLNETSKYGLSSEEVMNLLDTPKYFELLKLPYPMNQEGVINRLVDDRFIVREGAGFSIPRLSALVLAKQLEDFPQLTPSSSRFRPEMVC